MLIEPTAENDCTKRCYALAWSVRAVPGARLTATPSHISEDELATVARESATVQA